MTVIKLPKTPKSAFNPGRPAARSCSRRSSTSNMPSASSQSASGDPKDRRRSTSRN